jgi:transposase InsO family protein
VARLFAAHGSRYGSPRITADPRDAGWRVSENTVAALMREQGPGHPAQAPATVHDPAGEGPVAGAGPGQAGLPRAADQPDVVWRRHREGLPPGLRAAIGHPVDGQPGSALDNAVIEAWHSTLEFELRRVQHFTANAAARAKVTAWIEDYNTTRRHSALGMLSPVAYEQALAAGQAA